MDYIPRQGDIIRIDFDPQTGHEQKGRRPAIVVSNNTYNNFAKGAAMVCPITNTDRDIPIHLRLDGRTKTTGVVMTDQVKALDIRKRNADFIEKAPEDFVMEICDIVSGFTEIEYD